MKKYLLLILTTAFSLGISAQTQQGVVKTKGRLGNNGIIITGTRLSGATVSVKGGNSVVSGNNGTFSLAIPTSSYYLQNVQKKGYCLIDPDVLSKKYELSKNPLVLVMETPEQIADDQLTAEKKIRRTLQQRLQKKEDEIEALRWQRRITEKECREKLMALYASQEDNEKFISQMAKRYTQLDYDQLDAFNRQISMYILNGELLKADSLLKTKGDIVSDVSALHHFQQMNAKEKEELARRQERLNKSIEYEKWKAKDISQRCYSKFEILKLSQQYDSACYYIKLRAELDTTNVKNLIEAYEFENEYIEEVGWNPLKRALIISRKFYGERSLEYALCCNRLGELYSNLTYKEAYDASSYLNKALNIFRRCFGEKHAEIVRSYFSYGQMYETISQGIYEKGKAYKRDLECAKDYFKKALNIYSQLNGLNHPDVAKCYLRLYNLSNDKKYIPLVEKAYKSINSGKNVYMANYYFCMGCQFYQNEFIHTPNSRDGYYFENMSKLDDHRAIHKEVENYKKSVTYLRKAQELYKELLSEKYPKGQEAGAIAEQIEKEINIFEQALKYPNPFKIIYELWDKR